MENGGNPFPAFSVNSIFSTAMRSAPQFLLHRMSSVLLGLILGYSSILLLLGPLPFFYGMLQLAATLLVAYGLAVLTRNGVSCGSSFLLTLLDANRCRTARGRAVGSDITGEADTQLD